MFTIEYNATKMMIIDLTCDAELFLFTFHSIEAAISSFKNTTVDKKIKHLQNLIIWLAEQLSQTNLMDEASVKLTLGALS